MNFKEALDIILKELPPKKIDLERPSENNLVLIFKGVKQYNGERGVLVPIISLILGLIFLIIAFMNFMETILGNFTVTGGQFFAWIVGGALCWWGVKELLQIEDSQTVFRRWLEFSLTEKGGELQECITGKPIKLLTHFEWQEITHIFLEQQKRMENNKRPYCVHLQSDQYQDTYLFEWDNLGQELFYVTNLLKALWQVQQQGIFPENWNQPPEEDPPFMDLSGHLVDS